MRSLSFVCASGWPWLHPVGQGNEPVMHTAAILLRAALHSALRVALHSALAVSWAACTCPPSSTAVQAAAKSHLESVKMLLAAKAPAAVEATAKGRGYRREHGAQRGVACRLAMLCRVECGWHRAESDTR